MTQGSCIPKLGTIVSPVSFLSHLGSDGSLSFPQKQKLIVFLLVEGSGLHTTQCFRKEKREVRVEGWVNHSDQKRCV